jgi:quercetin dioxygenase-like cupin family protein
VRKPTGQGKNGIFPMAVKSLRIEHWVTERDGPLSEAALRRKLEARGYRVTEYVYPPGTVFPDHTHAVDKIDAVLSGQFRMVLEGVEAILGPGDCLAVPRNAVHSAAVVGDEPVVSLDAVRA